MASQYAEGLSQVVLKVADRVGMFIFIEGLKKFVSHDEENPLLEVHWLDIDR